jgi:hypothetical protein
VSPTEIGCIVLVCVFASALLRMDLHTILHEHHLTADSKP